MVIKWDEAVAEEDRQKHVMLCMRGKDPFQAREMSAFVESMPPAAQILLCYRETKWFVIRTAGWELIKRKQVAEGGVAPCGGSSKGRS